MSDLFVCTNDKTHALVGMTPKYCSECGAPTSARKCACGNLLNDTQKYCESCGEPALAHAAEGSKQ